PLFESVSWLTWQAIGHDVRSAPLGFCVASVLPWGVLIFGLTYWLRRETGSRTASLATVALVAQSPLVLETVWWYSASSFTWAILGVLMAVIGAGHLSSRPRLGTALIGTGSGVGPAFSTIGILAVPLVVIRLLFDSSVARRKRVTGIAAGVMGVAAY